MNDKIKVFCSPGKGLSESSIKVKWSSDYRMKPHSVKKDLIEEVWKEKSKQNIKLFDALKFRLHDVQETCEIYNPSPTITFLLGTTSYKEFIGTNFAPYADILSKDGSSRFGNSQVYMSDPLGVGSLLETRDQKLIFIRRSNTCAEMQGLIDRPGGHPEPEEVMKSTHSSLDDTDPSLITHEIFSSVLKEIRDEVNVPIENLSPPILLGIFYNPDTFKRPSLEFHVRCELDSEEVQRLYSEQTQAECYESTELIVLPLSDVLKIGRSQSGDFWNMLTFPAQSALVLLSVFYA